MISAKLCSTVLGQEKTAVLDSLKLRAKLVKEAYGSIEGVMCNEVQGAMYAFPQLVLPPKAVEKARVSPIFFSQESYHKSFIF
ncbi:unnamed protein product [Strongylus vulgaris]|uniref:Uncharacterized protein n=1 Tax=Strongylus vulgaris TaxID=40348 RepID=A0A3P7JP34_STRVU|nr:unnamed protein product [Strongylus vulgaris]